MKYEGVGGKLGDLVCGVMHLAKFFTILKQGPIRLQTGKDISTPYLTLKICPMGLKQGFLGIFIGRIECSLSSCILYIYI